MPRVYLCRHAQTTWNVTGRYQGRLESTLTELGIAQAEALAEHFASDPFFRVHPIGRIVSSPMLRCLATAESAAGKLGLTVEVDPRLIEIAHGTWEGRYRDEIAANDSERYRLWREHPERVEFERGETLSAVRERWREFARALRPQNDTLVVTHDAVVRVALLDTCGRSLSELWDVSLENAGYLEFLVENGRWSAGGEQRTAHLKDLRASIAGQAL